MTQRQAEVVWLNAPGKIEVRHEQLRTPEKTELQCESLVTAISPGTELAAYKGLPPLRPGVTYPRLVGYCNVGRVLEVGSEVRGISRGDRILSFTSHRSAFIIDQKDVLYKLPDNSKAEEIVCTYLFHLGYNAVLRGNVRPGSRVLVIGLGVLGLASVAMASIAGAQVFALSDQDIPCSIAMKMGAEAVFKRNELDSLVQKIGPNMADVVISTTNSWSDWQTAIQMAGQLGTITVLGFPGRGVPPSHFNPLDSQYFYMKQLRVEAVGWSPEGPESRGFCRFNERANLEYLASLIIRGRLNASLLVSGCYESFDLRQAYIDLLERRSSPITYLIKWNNN